MPSLTANSSGKIAEALFDQVRSGDQKAFEKLFAIYYPRLNDFARKVVRDEDIAEDIVQDTFVKFWEKRVQLTNQNIEALLYRMVRNRCIDYIKFVKVVSNRKYQLQISARTEELYRIDFTGNEPCLLIEEELQVQIQKTINNLPARCREVFLLSRIEGLKNKEIAEKLNFSIQNVERHLSRALNTFRKDFSGELPVALLILVLKNL